MDERGGTVDVRAVTTKQNEESTAENVRKAQHEEGDVDPPLDGKRCPQELRP